MANPQKRALLIGNSDGIGRAFTATLLADGWSVTGLSRSDVSQSDVSQGDDSQSDASSGGAYSHVQVDVTTARYPRELELAWENRGPFDLVAHCVGIGTGISERGFGDETRTMVTNLVSLVQLVDCVFPKFLERGRGHLLGLSSIADDGFIADSPSYSGSKAGYSNYLKSLARHGARHGVAVTNVRFGFVDTKMAKAEKKPLMITPERAAELLMWCVRTRPVQLTYPKLAGAFVRVVRWWHDLWIWTRRG